MIRSIGFVITLFASATSLAGGFLIYEHGAVATGMADARTASRDNVNALYFNPAALTELPGLQFQIGMTGILPFVHYDAKKGEALREYLSTDENGNLIYKPVNDGQNDMDAKVRGFTPVHLYATYQFEDLGLVVGYGMFSPFGLGTYYPADFDGRYIANETEIVTFFNQPTLAWDIAKFGGFKDSLKLSLAVGYNYVYSTASLSRHFDLRVTEIAGYEYTNAQGEMQMTGSANGHGYNVALFAEIPGILAFGASVRSSVALKFSGTAHFLFNAPGKLARALLADPPDSFGLEGPMTFADKSKGKLDITLPWNMNFGLAYLGIENLKLAIDVYLAKFDSYKELDMRFDCVSQGTCTALEGVPPIPKNWSWANQYSLGAEYQVPELASAFRLGAALVTSGVPDNTWDPALPDGTRYLFCIGYGYRSSSYSIDVGYMYSFWEGTKDIDKGNLVGAGNWNPDLGKQVPMGENPEGMAMGTYRSQAHLLALSLSAWF